MKRCFSSYTFSILSSWKSRRHNSNIKYLCKYLLTAVAVISLPPFHFHSRRVRGDSCRRRGMSSCRRRRRRSRTRSTLLRCWTSPGWQQNRSHAGDSTPHLRGSAHGRRNNKEPAAQQSPTQGNDEPSGLQGCGVHTRHTFQSILKQETVITSKQFFSHQGPHLSKNKCHQSACY